MAPPFPPLTADQLAHLHDSKSREIVSVSVVMMVLAITLVAARFHARSVRKLPRKADDWLMIPAMILTCLLCVENIVAVHFGNGKHIYAVGLSTGLNFLKMAYILSITYSCVHFAIKMSILLLYRRIFTTADRTFRIMLYSVMAYITGWSISALFVCIFACTPIPFYWNQAIGLLGGPLQSGHCINLVAAQSGINVTNAVADLLILTLPSLVLWKLKLSTSRKIALTAIFSLGAFACAVSIVRIVVVYQEGPDFTWDDSELFLWTAIEPTVGILCACFPVIAPAFSGGLFQQSFGKTSLGRYIYKVFGSQVSADCGTPGHDKGVKYWPGSKSTGESSSKSTKVHRNSHLSAHHSFIPLQDSGTESFQLHHTEPYEEAIPSNGIRVRTDLELGVESR